MKILPVNLIREADAYTIVHEPVSDIDLMERASHACFDWIMGRIEPGTLFRVFAGRGNNGGDGLAIARMLLLAGHRVIVHLAASPAELSPSCRTNYDRLLEILTLHSGCSMDLPDDRVSLPVIERSEVVIDALFGSGLTRPPDGIASRLIALINASEARVISIDVPSGLFCDSTSYTNGKAVVVEADYTLTFSPPKMAFFFPENDRFTGEWHLLDIGIHKTFIETVETVNFMVTAEMAKQLIRPRNRFAHKGHFGHALLISGSDGKMGAAVLAARACMRSGPGLVTVHVPGVGRDIFPVAVPEAMISVDSDNAVFSTLPDLSPYNAIGIGPGLGTHEKTAVALKLLLQEYARPVVFDADALNLLGEHKTWMGFLPPGSVLTPHPKEFSRIVGRSWNDDFERNRIQRELSSKLNCYIVLKGAFTAITSPDGQCFFNTTGNPGMATGGSGDVLTGMITGLFAQGYTPLESCLLGVYLHGLAGDLAMHETGQEALIAGDIINQIGNSFLLLYGKL